MSMFNSEEITKIITALNGKINPVGETNADNDRYENLKNLEAIIDCLLDDIQLLISNKNRYEYSVKRVGIEAVKYLGEIRERITDWFKEYEVGE